MQEKVKLPPVEFFYRLAMKRSAELKSKVETIDGWDESSIQSEQTVRLGGLHDEQTSCYNQETPQERRG